MGSPVKIVLMVKGSDPVAIERRVPPGTVVMMMVSGDGDRYDDDEEVQGDGEHWQMVYHNT